MSALESLYPEHPRLGRILNTVANFGDGKAWIYAITLADEFNRSKRTIQRDMARLKSDGNLSVQVVKGTRRPPPGSGYPAHVYSQNYGIKRLEGAAREVWLAPQKDRWARAREIEAKRTADRERKRKERQAIYEATKARADKIAADRGTSEAKQAAEQLKKAAKRSLRKKISPVVMREQSQRGLDELRFGRPSQADFAAVLSALRPPPK